MGVSITAALNARTGYVDPIDLHEAMESLRADVARLAKKLDADGGVTDANYAAQLKTEE